jgi:hypothetical protein
MVKQTQEEGFSTVWQTTISVHGHFVLETNRDKFHLQVLGGAEILATSTNEWKITFGRVLTLFCDDNNWIILNEYKILEFLPAKLKFNSIN